MSATLAYFCINYLWALATLFIQQTVKYEANIRCKGYRVHIVLFGKVGRVDLSNGLYSVMQNVRRQIFVYYNGRS